MEFAWWTLLAFASALTIEGPITVDAENITRPSFTVDYEANQFLLDGRPFQYVSGSFHYFRTPRIYWRDRLRKMRAGGLNAVSTYVEWSLHEPYPGQWNWGGDADLEYFLTLAQEEDLYVLLRPGPYICAERDFGGFPFWLLSEVPDIRLRTSDPRYMNYVTIYINELMRKMKPLLRGNGGPVIMVQVENEYGSFNACDFNYTSQLRDIFAQHVGSDALLFTTDGATNKMLRCGKIPEVYATVDFGVSWNVRYAFAIMRLFQPRGPLVNSEFYSGWLTHWEEPNQMVNGSAVAKTLDDMLALGASVNIYMYYGGTNFGFTSGANTDPRYRPQLTSYDYDAPLTEAGDLTEKYYLIKNVISKYLTIPSITMPEPILRGSYGLVRLDPVLKLFDPVARDFFAITKPMQKEPPTFESFGVPLALVLYETDLPVNRSDPSTLRAEFIHDRALVYEDDHFRGTLSRTHEIKTISLSDPYAKKLKILVENQGHINYGNKIHDLKGVGNVTLNGLPLSNWNATGFQIPEHLNRVHNLTSVLQINQSEDHSPLLLTASFTVPDVPLDTFMDTTGWGKGIAFVNGNNLGRYWPAVGPQLTLYVPATFLKPGANKLILLELEHVPESRNVTFRTNP